MASDRRLKENILPIPAALEKISKLQGVYFNWIQNEQSGLSMDKYKHSGLIAQEVQRVFPEAVGRYDKYLGVDYSALVPLLIESIKDLNLIWKEKNTRIQNQCDYSELYQDLKFIKNEIQKELSLNNRLKRTIISMQQRLSILNDNY
jgi:hypothetical protein